MAAFRQNQPDYCAARDERFPRALPDIALTQREPLLTDLIGAANLALGFLALLVALNRPGDAPGDL